MSGQKIIDNVREALASKGEPLICSAGGIPYNKALLDAKDAKIAALQSDIERITKEKEETFKSYTLAWNQRDAQRRRAEAAESSLSSMTARCKEILGETGKGYLTVRDLCFTAFMRAKDKNDEDGGPTDWFTDTLPLIEKGLDKLRARALSQTKGNT